MAVFMYTVFLFSRIRKISLFAKKKKQTLNQQKSNFLNVLFVIRYTKISKKRQK